MKTSKGRAINPSSSVKQTRVLWRRPWQTGWRLAAALLLFAGPVQAHSQSTSIRITADAQRPGKPLVHFWSKVVGAGRANEGLRSTWQEELQMAHQYDGFQYVRFHGIFHDDMFVYREDEHGDPIYNYQYIDDLFDRMLAKGVKPFVELGFSPAALATVKDTTFWCVPTEALRMTTPSGRPWCSIHCSTGSHDTACLR